MELFEIQLFNPLTVCKKLLMFNWNGGQQYMDWKHLTLLTYAK